MKNYFVNSNICICYLVHCYLTRPFHFLRTVLGSYFVLQNGQKAKHTTDLGQFPWSDMVTFYIGCVAHCVKRLLWDSGIPVQEKESSPLYITNLSSNNAGPFSSSVVVSLLSIPKNLLQKAVDITVNFKDLPSMPIHIGDPCVIGIRDISKPDFGDSPNIQDRVPVFWASSVTAHLGVRSAGKFCFGLFLLGLSLVLSACFLLHLEGTIIFSLKHPLPGKYVCVF